MIYVNKIDNRITFKIKAVLSRSFNTGNNKITCRAKNKVTKDKNLENVPHLKITKLLWVHCNIVNNDYQQDSGTLYTFIPNKSFGPLLDISPKNFIFLKTFESGFPYIEVWLNGQNYNVLEKEDKMNINLVIN